MPGKRKRLATSPIATHLPTSAKLVDTQSVHSLSETLSSSTTTESNSTLQIVVGTYEKILHGFTASFGSAAQAGKPCAIDFADTFMFNAHGSSIKTLALSPVGKTDARTILASGGSDQMVNLYSISAEAQAREFDVSLPSLSGSTVLENPRNQEIGTLEHHAGSVNALYFPSSSKLISAAADSTIAVARTHDWTILSTIKAPRPHVQGRASGDTTSTDGGPSGINDIAIHPSMKLMLTVSKGERCMRLWNLVTGKKAAVLNFERDLLQAVGTGKHDKAEGQKVRWDEDGEEFVVGFDHGCAIFGLDSKCKGHFSVTPRTKIHQIQYLPRSKGSEKRTGNILAVSTEDGRLIFYSTKRTQGKDDEMQDETSSSMRSLPSAFAELGEPADRLGVRIKDFKLIKGPDEATVYTITATSDGAVRIWSLRTDQLHQLVAQQRSSTDNYSSVDSAEPTDNPAPTGKILGSYETGHRITCLAAFLLREPRTKSSSKTGAKRSRVMFS